VSGHVGGGVIVFEVFCVVFVCSLGKYFTVRVLYVCMCVHLGESNLVNRPAFLVSPIPYSKYWNIGLI
jgi:hypothetical protein